MTPLAIIAKEAGFTVSGCDISDEFITDEALQKAGITPLVGFTADHLKGIDLLITTGAHGGFDNPEVKAAKNLGIGVLTQGEAVGEFMKGTMFDKTFEGISVAGSHGKTTTTAMIATVLKINGFDPSYVIGTSGVPSLGLPGHFGKGKYFIAEADEYATEPQYDKTPKLLRQHPQIAIFTNIEFDHPDIFSSIDDVRNIFLQFANNLPQNGLLITCADSEEIKNLLKNYKKPYKTYGLSPVNDFSVSKISISHPRMFFRVQNGETSLGEFSLGISGEHNAVNALGALVCCLELGLSVDQIRKGLSAFTGSKRRFEFVGELESGALLYDDYAHHPTEIQKTLSAFAKSFPKSRLVVVFQPHTYSRTKCLFDEFAKAFSRAHTVILTDIYASAREEPDPSVNSRQLGEVMKGHTSEVVYLPGASDVVEYMNQNSFGKDTIVITMGAGDIYKISEELKVKS